MGRDSTPRSTPSRGANIFICYRREDTAGYAGRLYDRLSARFGDDRIFMDVDKIGPGIDFIERIEEAVSSSGVLLALIGRSWLMARSPDGTPRLDDPEDFVRVEIARALESGLLVIPLLVEGAVMPRAEDLPERLHPLVRRNPLELANERFDYDVGQVIQAAEEVVGAGTTVTGRDGPVLPAEAPPSAEERKVVTVLVCDLVGFGAATEGADPEDVWAILGEYHGLIRREIERFDGTVDRLIDDTGMAVFGAPVSHEDDSERAVRAGLRIVEAVPELSESRGLSIAVQIGVATGEAVVTLGGSREGESLVSGTVVNTASRVQAAAPPGAVAVGETTHRATGHVFNYTELPPIDGKGAPLQAWHAVEARSRYATGIERPTTPFIDREDDLALLKGLYKKALLGNVQLVTIIGEPGVGKSRLIAEFSTFVDDLPDLIRWREGRCLPYGEGITFWALGEIVKAEAGILESDGAPEASAKLSDSLEALVQDGKDRQWLNERLGPLVGLQTSVGPAKRDETFTAWRRYLEVLAAHGPLVMVVEDLHAADPAMLDFIEHLVEYASDVQLMVIATARPELYEQRPSWSGGIRAAMTISLIPLSDTDCASLISALLEQAVLPAEVQDELLARAGGNPLYAEEFVRMLVDRGLISRGGQAAEAPGLDGTELPVTVQALIAARLDTLTPSRKALLQDASVMGRVFWSGAVAEMRDQDEASVRDELHELVRKELVREGRTSTVQGEVEYSFWHGLVRDVCYGQIPRAERGRKHRAAAGWIEALAGERVADHAEVLAYHYRLALDLARASGGADVAQLEESSLRFLVMAGERAMALDVERAESHYRGALDLAPPGQADRGPILMQLGEALFMEGRFDDSEWACTEAVQELGSTDRPLAVGEAKRMLARLLAYRGDVAGSRHTLEEAVRILEALPPGQELVRALSDLAYDHSVSGYVTEGLKAVERAIQLAREQGLEVEEVRALPRRGTVLHMLGDPRGVEDFRSALERGQVLGLGRDMAVTYNNLGEALWPTEGPASALESFRAGITFSEARGMVLDAYTNRASSLGPTLMIGQWDEALTGSDEVVAWLRAAGVTLTEAWAAMWQALVLLGRGDWSRAEPLVQRYLPGVRDIGDLENVLPALAVGALLERDRGDLRASITMVREFRDVAEGQGTWYRAQFLPDLVRICTEAGDMALGEELLEGAPDRLPGHRLALGSAEATLTEARGDRETAARLYGESAAALEAFEWVVEHGFALLGAGRSLLELQRPREAVANLRNARKVFVGLGAGPAVAETDALLARAAPHADDGLT